MTVHSLSPAEEEDPDLQFEQLQGIIFGPSIYKNLDTENYFARILPAMQGGANEFTANFVGIIEKNKENMKKFKKRVEKVFKTTVTSYFSVPKFQLRPDLEVCLISYKNRQEKDMTEIIKTIF